MLVNIEPDLNDAGLELNEPKSSTNSNTPATIESTTNTPKNLEDILTLGQ